MFSLKEQNILITGATGGIGKAIVDAVLKQGAHVVLSGTSEEKLTSFKNELSTHYPQQKIEIIQANLFEFEQVDTLFQKAEERLGNIHVLVNNAGITRDNLLMRMRDDEWFDVMRMNLESIFRLSRAAIKSMMKQRYGRIINMSSVVGFSGNAGQTNYCASKAGIIGFSKALAKEVATRNITVNCIAPGFIESDMTQAIPDDIQTKIKANIPANRVGQPEDIAAAVVYLASKEASYMTGQTLHVNGGLEMI